MRRCMLHATRQVGAVRVSSQHHPNSSTVNRESIKLPMNVCKSPLNISDLGLLIFLGSLKSVVTNSSCHNVALPIGNVEYSSYVGVAIIYFISKRGNMLRNNGHMISSSGSIRTSTDDGRREWLWNYERLPLLHSIDAGA